MGWAVEPQPGYFTLGKDPVPFIYEAVWVPGSVRKMRKILPVGFDPRTVQPVASRYTD
jgi:hypothetical protein